MVGASKILTVSYGTFSCTLEGFDDPFNTMKAIAEYFRDLAADDRYFGAEPPTPDAAMLHRIAEREIQRRVEAKVDDHGVVLRASDLAPQPVVQPAAAPAPQPAPSVASPGLLSEESVAAKLQRIRSAVARAAAAPAPVVEDAVYAEDIVEAPAPAPAVAAPAEPVIAVEAEFAREPAPEQAPVIEEVAAAEEPETVVAEPEDEPEAVAELSTEEDLPEYAPVVEVAADLDLDLEDIEVFSEPDPVEEEALIAALAASVPVESQLEADTDEPAVETVVMADEQDEVAQDDLTLDTLSGILAGLNSDVTPAAPAVEAEAIAAAEAEEAEAAEIAEEIEPDSRWLTAVEMSAEDAEASFASEAVALEAEEDTFEMEETVEAEDTIVTEEAEEEFLEDLEEEIEPVAADRAASADEPEEPSIEEKLRRARARVIRVRRPDAVAPIAAEEPALRGEGRTILEAHSKGDEDVTRLLRQTNTEMDGPENRRRMLTLSHLKAAVAATVADLRSGGKSKGEKPSEAAEEKGLDSYRADLASVVRPRRPTADRALAEKPAPLVLVSEQRIDAAPRPVDAVGTRVLPRRVTAGNLAVSDEDEEDEEGALPDAENIFAQSSSFAEFAERLGATEIPDLLEAAAAYTACFEGRPHFSRPHLLRYVATLPDGTEVNRETGLRSFGTLLRQGKIEKVKRGQFMITDNSYYLAEARRMVR